MSFDSLGLSAELLRAARERGYAVPTPIQRAAIPAVLAGRDLMASAQTGTGKTAGFALPLLQRLAAAPPETSRAASRGVRALVLAPTRELAMQVGESVAVYGRHLALDTAVVFGGVSIRPQIERLARGVDVLVATPGRLLDHAAQGTVDLAAVEILVLDEADRMLDMGFIHDIRRVLRLLPAKGVRQTLLFSATFSREIRALAATLLEAPERIDVAPPNATADRVDQLVHPVERTRKRELLSRLVREGDWRQVLVFTRTKHGANRLAEQLDRDGLAAAAIHGNKSQNARTRALAGFKSGAVRVLVATDIAARGLDIEELPHVVNFDLPNVAEDYVHRIGRTARAGRSGQAVSLVAAEERELLDEIERLIGRGLPERVVVGFEPGRTGTLERPAGADSGRRRARGGRRGDEGAAHALAPVAGRRPDGDGANARQRGRGRRRTRRRAPRAA